MSKTNRKPGGRTPLPIRRMGSEVIADRRTRRRRTRGQSERNALLAEMVEDDMSDPGAILGADEDEGDDDE